jgi:nitrogen regulatory protein PII
MPQLIVFVVDNPEKTDDVVDAWMALGVPGVTIFDSSGIGRETSKRDLLDSMPLMPSLSSLLRTSREAPHCTLFAVVSDNFNMDALAQATQKITGEFDEPNTGILFTVPISRVWETASHKITR